jgi:hypothetical protein
MCLRLDILIQEIINKYSLTNIVNADGWVYVKIWKSMYRLSHAGLVGKSVRNLAEFRDYSISGPFELQNFHWNFIFPIVKCVPANSEHFLSSLESSPAIDSSNFMNWKTFLALVLFWPVRMTFTCIPQLVDPVMLNLMDVGTNPGKAILLPI